GIDRGGVGGAHERAVIGGDRRGEERALESELVLPHIRVGNGDDAGGGVHLVLGKEGHGTAEGDLTAGISNSDRRRETVALEVDPGTVDVEGVVHPDRFRPGFPAGSMYGDVGAEV